MKLTNKNMVEQILVRIKTIHDALEKLEFAVRVASGEGYRTDLTTGNLREKLIDLELNEWRNLGMWGLTLSSEEQDRIKVAFHERFLKTGMSVLHWWNNGITPGSYYSADEDEFRKMAKEAFAPKGIK